MRKEMRDGHGLDYNVYSDTTTDKVSKSNSINPTDRDIPVTNANYNYNLDIIHPTRFDARLDSH